MDTCHTSLNSGLNFADQCLNYTKFNGTDFFEKDAENNFNNGFVLSVGFILAMILDSDVVKKKFRAASRLIFSEELKFNLLSKLLSLFCLLISLFIIPFILIIFSICFAYRTTIHYILKYRNDKRYRGLLDGTDVVWAIEDVSKSVINILAVINIENTEEFKQKLTENMTAIIEDPKFAKLKYFRQKSYGYYYWIENTFQVNGQISYLPEKSTEDNCLKKDDLLQILEDYSNRCLPQDHTTSWEILIGNQKLQTKENTYPILFRFHHSIGDGLALLKILLQASDKKNDQPIITNENDKTPMMVIKYKLLSIFQTILSIIFVPGHLIHMNLMKTIDKNVLHGKSLTGEKTLAWFRENEDFEILKSVKYIKSQFLGVSFLDVILLALSEAFYEYFEQKTTEIPPSITSVILERIDKILPSLNSSLSSSELHNRFTVGMITLPILPAPGIEHRVSGTEDHFETGRGSDPTTLRLKEVSKETTTLKLASPEFQINYWLLKVVSKLLPETILRPMLHSAHSTMVVSNICGPDKVTICDGQLIEDLIFWLPHRGLTGIGVSVLSYAGKLQIGISADKALISNSEEADLILQNFVKSLKTFSDKLKRRTTHNKELE